VKPRVSNSTVFALCVLACVAPGLPLAAAEPSAAPPDFAWLAGNWLSCRADGYVEERWLGPSRGILVGATLTHGRRRTGFEYARIAPAADGAYAFHAQPGGRPPVEFRLVTNAPGQLVFENRDHDFPQRIEYRLDRAVLVARVSGEIDGRTVAEEWRYERRRDHGAAACPATAAPSDHALQEPAQCAADDNR
jgi:hypothetical protein